MFKDLLAKKKLELILASVISQSQFPALTLKDCILMYVSLPDTDKIMKSYLIGTLLKAVF